MSGQRPGRAASRGAGARGSHSRSRLKGQECGGKPAFGVHRARLLIPICICLANFCASQVPLREGFVCVHVILSKNRNIDVGDFGKGRL
jgi:hypothetical protein